jgi:hypothetical protein
MGIVDTPNLILPALHKPNKRDKRSLMQSCISHFPSNKQNAMVEDHSFPAERYANGVSHSLQQPQINAITGGGGFRIALP